MGLNRAVEDVRPYGTTPNEMKIYFRRKYAHPLPGVVGKANYGSSQLIANYKGVADGARYHVEFNENKPYNL